MADESGLWSWIKAGLPAYAHASRIENMIGKAMPDIEFCLNREQVWIESKVLKGLVRNGSRGTLRFENGQREWAHARWAAGGLSFVLIGVPVIGASERIGEVLLVPGGWALSLPQKGIVSMDTLRDMSLLHHAMGAIPLKNKHTLNCLLYLLGNAEVEIRQRFDRLSRPAYLTEWKAPADSFLDELLMDNARDL